MSEPLIVETMRQYRADLLARDAQQMREMVRQWRRVENALSARMDLLAQRMADMQAEGLPITPGMIAREVRYRELIAQAQVEVNQYAQWLRGRIGDEQLVYGKLGIESAAEAIQLALIEGAFNVLPVDAIQNMIGLAGDGSPLMTLLSEAWPTSADGMMAELIRSTALGINPRVTAKALADGLSRGLNRCMTIARTEQLRVYREANRQQMIESGVVLGYKRVANKDMQTCAGCLFADGMEFDLLAEFAEHPNGRCVAVPIVKGEGALTWQYGPQWFAQQDQSTQQAILGPTRWEMWQSGKVSLPEMVSIVDNETWGPNIGVKPIGELGG